MWRTRRRAVSAGAPALATVGLIVVGAAGSLGAQEEPRSGEMGEREVPGEERCVCVDVPDARRIREMVRIRRDDGVHLGVSVSLEREPDGDARGVPISQVLEGSPAQEAGLRAGDVIVAFDGHPLDEPLPDAEDEDELEGAGTARAFHRLRRLLAGREEGDEVEVAYLRDGERRTATARLESRALRWAARAPGPPPPHRFGERAAPMPPMGVHPHMPRPPAVHRLRFRDEMPERMEERMERRMERGLRGPRGAFRWMDECRELAGENAFLGRGCVAGLEARTLDRGLGEYFGTDEGVLVLAVSEGSPLGLRPGDVILSVGERDVRELGDLHRILGSYQDDEEVSFRVRRQDRELTVTGRMP